MAERMVQLLDPANDPAIAPVSRGGGPRVSSATDTLLSAAAAS